MATIPRRPAVVLLLVIWVALTSCVTDAGRAADPGAAPPSSPVHRPGPAPGPRPAPGRPNVVFVLTDDLSMNLLPYLPHVLDLARAGTSFSNYTVTDSLCCPSRASILSGKFPHDTGVFTNSPPDGGYQVFHARGEERSTFATALRRVGYRTAMLGKYLNGYDPRGGSGPPGWTEWDVAGNGYPGFDYDLSEDHRLRHHGHAPGDYLTDVLAERASEFITASAAARAPFFVEVATFAPHWPYTPAPRDADSFPGLTAPRGPAFDTLPTGAPPWLAGWTPLDPRQQADLDDAFRRRAQSVQAVDRLIGTIQDTLTRAGVAGDTVVVFSSDNGYHLGEYRLPAGKMTAFDVDVHVPLVVAGPGVAAGRTVAEPVQNIDLCPTFEQLGGAPVPADVDGHSLTELLSGRADPDWRTAALIEHHGPDTDAHDPDHPGPDGANPPSYRAVRAPTYTYVEYSDGSREYYDRTGDPDELHDTATGLPPARLSDLHRGLATLTGCHGQAACWSASHLSTP